MIKRRRKWCQKYLNWTEKDWARVMLSDESIIRQFSMYACFVRRPKNTRFKKFYTIKTVKHSKSLMVWGTMSAKGPGAICFLPPGETMNSQTYISMLAGKLKQYMQAYGCKIYMHDGAPCHKAKNVSKRLQSQISKSLISRAIARI